MADLILALLLGWLLGRAGRGLTIWTLRINLRAVEGERDAARTALEAHRGAWADHLKHCPISHQGDDAA